MRGSLTPPAYTDQPTTKEERLWRVSIANLRVSGNEKSGAGIKARYVEEIMIHGVTSSYTRGDGLRLYSCYEDPRISDNLFTYNKQCGIYIEACHDIIVSANHFEENQTGLQCMDSFNLTMSGNNFSDTWIGDDADGKPQQRRENKPSKNEENPNEAAGILLEDCKGAVISGNLFSRLSTEAVIQTGDCRKILLDSNGVYEDDEQ